jgi:hypothetical protein|tara:strand:+ start:1470 stop:1670 length:201 start_codon:yes stop_codon:yes gene_type:complete
MEEAGEAALEVAQEEVAASEGLAQARQAVSRIALSGAEFKGGVHFALVCAGYVNTVSRVGTSRPVP